MSIRPSIIQLSKRAKTGETRFARQTVSYRAFKSFPPTCAVEMCFRNQCEQGWRKHFLKSAGCPESPQIFRPAKPNPFTLKRREADFQCQSALRIAASDESLVAR
jgi:hypothetical protein